MRARIINEKQEFHRSGNPKVALEIGGTLLGKIRTDIKRKAEKEWKDFIFSLVGKTITGQLNKIWVKSDSSDQPFKPGPGWGQYTIEIEKIWDTDNIELNMQGIEVYSDGAMYIIPLGEKIYIK